MRQSFRVLVFYFCAGFESLAWKGQFSCKGTEIGGSLFYCRIDEYITLFTYCKGLYFYASVATCDEIFKNN